MKIDSQKQFLRHTENCFNFLTWSDLTAQRRILLVNITRRKSPFVATYIQHLNVWARVYQQWGVDAVYLITNDQRYDVLAVDTMAKQLPVLGDVGGEFAQALGEHCGLQHSPETLSRFWNYQALIKHGELEQVYYQPMDNLVKNLVYDTKDLDLAKQIQPLERFHLTPFFLKNSSYHTQRVLYYRLHPNADLKNYLCSTAR